MGKKVRLASNEEIEANKQRQAYLRSLGYNVPTDGSWGNWQLGLWDKEMNKTFPIPKKPHDAVTLAVPAATGSLTLGELAPQILRYGPAVLGAAGELFTPAGLLAAVPAATVGSFLYGMTLPVSRRVSDTESVTTYNPRDYTVATTDAIPTRDYSLLGDTFYGPDLSKKKNKGGNKGKGREVTPTPPPVAPPTEPPVVTPLPPVAEPAPAPPVAPPTETPPANPPATETPDATKASAATTSATMPEPQNDNKKDNDKKDNKFKLFKWETASNSPGTSTTGRYLRNAGRLYVGTGVIAPAYDLMFNTIGAASERSDVEHEWKWPVSKRRFFLEKGALKLLSEPYITKPKAVSDSTKTDTRQPVVTDTLRSQIAYPTDSTKPMQMSSPPEIINLDDYID